MERSPSGINGLRFARFDDSLNARISRRRIGGRGAASGTARVARRASVRGAGVANGVDAVRLHHYNFVVSDRRGFGGGGFRDRARGDAGTGVAEATAESAFATDKSGRRGKNQKGNDQGLFNIALA